MNNVLMLNWIFQNLKLSISTRSRVIEKLCRTDLVKLQPNIIIHIFNQTIQDVFRHKYDVATFGFHGSFQGVPKMKKILRNILYRVPLGTTIYERAALILKPEFVGWGLSTIRTPPWSHNQHSDLARNFESAHEALLASIESGDFTLLQGKNQNMPPQRMLSNLKWRHYIVYWSVQYTCRRFKDEQINLAELGVFDGLTAHFAACAAQEQLETMSLYDSWEAMVGARLQKSENQMAGAYENNSEKVARHNLIKIADKAVFNRGFIPESFETAATPEKCHWLHIDLNSSDATKAALDFFYERLCPGGIILFDDYGARQFRLTRNVVDAFFQDKFGILLPLPTGQAIYFKL